MLCFHIIEAQESEVLIDREEERSMSLRQRLMITYDLDVLDQRIVNSFSHIELLEEIIIFFSLVVKLVNDVSVENILINVHQTLYIFETDIIFQGSGQEEEILNNTRSFILLSSQVIIWFEDCICKRFVCDSIIANNSIVFQHREFISHKLQVRIYLT